MSLSPAQVNAIASQLDGTARLVDSDGERLSCPMIELANERAGLVVYLRSSYVSGIIKIKATIGLTELERGGADYRATPPLHELAASAAATRSPRSIAAHIETRLVQPALPMLEEWKAKRAKMDAHKVQLEATVARYQALFPRARITIDRDSHHADFRLSTAHNSATDYAYMNARLNADGSLYIDRMSSVPEAFAVQLCGMFAETIS